MTQYLVYRSGSNAANQPMSTEPEPIAIVEAKSREQACELSWGDRKVSAYDCPSMTAEIVASCENLDVWPAQRLHAVPESRAKLSDWNYVLEQDAMRREYA